MKLTFGLLLLLNFYITGMTQNQLMNDFDFLSFTIKDTYAGYRDKVGDNEFDALVKRIKQSNSKDTFALLSKICTFFKDRHVLLTDDGINNQKIDTFECKRDSQLIQHYFSNKKRKDTYEGYWLSEFDYCVIALKKVKSNPATYYGYVMENKMKAIPGYCILKMVQQKDGTYYTDYTEENLAYRAFLHASFKNNNILWVDAHGGKWRRIKDYKPGILKTLTTFSYKPDFINIDTTTVLLKMNDFGAYNIKRFDSIIKANSKWIAQANTLIIDIRNNPGGYISNYLPLLPYICTGLIVHVGGYTLIGNQFIKQQDEKIKKSLAAGDSVSAKSHIAYRDTFIAKRGEYYFRKGDTLSKCISILPKPKNVAVIINNNCMSAAELMLLNFKQSQKVKLFGERTGGAVDYLNTMNFVLPRSRYNLTLASVKRQIKSSEPSYDATGISPDVEISDDVTDWINFVKKYYERHR